jgi:PadR family transcriptional regulator, regulatory protein PadR
MTEVRITVNVAKVLRCLLEEPDRPRYGYDLIHDAQVSAGSLYPILDRLHRAGWLRRDWEQVDPAQEGRPARRLYVLTPSGVAAARQALAELHEQLSPPTRKREPKLAPRPAGGS